MKIVDLNPLVRGNIEKRYNIPTNKVVYVDEYLRPFVKEGGEKRYLSEEG